MLAYLEGLEQSMQQWAQSLGNPGELMARLILAIIAGGLVGLERELRGRIAGFRTNVLVCLGSCLVMVVSISFGTKQWEHPVGFNLNVDPSRIAYGVMTGVGFLGAGAIIHNKGTVRGLTTAASLWCVAAIGLALGFGLYVVSLFCAILVVGVLWILDYFEDMLPRMRFRSVTVKRKWIVGCVAEAVKRFETANLKVVDAGFERSDDMSFAIIELHIKFSDKSQYYQFERHLEADPDYHLLATREL